MTTHQGAVRSFLARLTGGTALADDLAQITFLKAYQSKDYLREPKAARAWIYQIAYRTFVDEYRKSTRRQDMLNQYAPDAVALEHTPAIDGGIVMDVAKAMTSLSDECRAVVMLNLGQGFSHSEVSNITGLPLGTVKSHAARGKAKLKTFLSDYEKAI